MAYFEGRTAARRYAQDRPDVHPSAVRPIAAAMGPAAPVARALDVGCGTGQSTRALAAIADAVVGIDVSRAMLDEAGREGGPSYALATAERLPFGDGCFDVVTVGLAFHRFDQPRFLDEARRVLATTGWFAIDNSAFRGEMRKNPRFADWARRRYLARFPTPARNRPSVAPDAAEGHGFRHAVHDTFADEVPFTVDAVQPLTNWRRTKRALAGRSAMRRVK